MGKIIVFDFSDKEKDFLAKKKDIIKEIMTTEIYECCANPKTCKHFITNVFVYHGKDARIINPNPDKDIVINECLNCGKITSIVVR